MVIGSENQMVMCDGGHRRTRPHAHEPMRTSTRVGTWATTLVTTWPLRKAAGAEVRWPEMQVATFVWGHCRSDVSVHMPRAPLAFVRT